MKPIRFLLFIAILLGQTLPMGALLTYCMKDGDLCCLGWEVDTCCTESTGAGGLTQAKTCSDVVTSIDGEQAGGRLGQAPVCLPPAAVFAALLPTPRDRASEVAAAASPPPPRLRSTVLLL